APTAPRPRPTTSATPTIPAPPRSAAAAATAIPTTRPAASPTRPCCPRSCAAATSTSRPSAVSRPSWAAASRRCASASGDPEDPVSTREYHSAMSVAAAHYFPPGRSLARRVHGDRAVGLLYGQRALLIGALEPLTYTGTMLSTKSGDRPFMRLARPAKIHETVFLGPRDAAHAALSPFPHHP